MIFVDLVLAIKNDDTISTMETATEVAIWERVIRPEGKMSEKTARALLRLSLSQFDRARLHHLAVKSKKHKLSKAEEEELDRYFREGRVLSILKSEARKILKNGKRGPQ
jgi:hypothetical protein